MIRARLRQLARLEQKARPYIEQRQQAEKEWERTRQGAAAHAAIIAFLIRHGAPTIGEPLSHACQRCSQSEAWKECYQNFPTTPHRSCRNFEPYSRDRVTTIGAPVRHAIISDFPGADEKQKLDRIFASAPPWLIWFTYADYSAKLLGLSLPDLSEMTRFARSKANFALWWGLPSGLFEKQPRPYGARSGITR